MEEPLGRLEQLKRRLYRRGPFRAPKRRAEFSQNKEELPEDWGDNDLETKTEVVSVGMAKNIFFISLIFFIAMAGLAAFFLFSQSSIVSNDNINIAVRAPVSVKGGEILPIEVTITNNNPVSLESTDLAIEFPKGTRDASDLSIDFERHREFVGTVAPGQTIKKLYRVVLFGEEDSDQEVNISLEYRIEGSNAIIAKEKKYSILLTSAPVNMIINLPSEINAGQEITIDVEVSSQSDTVLDNMLLEANYPTGFRFTGGSPSPSFGNNVWRLGDLAPNSIRDVKITGVIEGQENEVKALRITIGTADREDFQSIGVGYSSSFETITIKRPFVGLTVLLDGSGEENVSTDVGAGVRGNVSWINNTTEEIRNGQILVTFQSPILNEASVNTRDGFYRSVDKTIVFNEQTNEGLGTIKPGGKGSVNFSFSSISSKAISSLGITNPSIDLITVFQGNMIKEDGGTSGIETKQEKTIKLNSQVQLSSRAVYSVGPFVNVGPLPPRANEETSYTIIWAVTNGPNDVENATIRATLPPYMRFSGLISPSTERVSFDQSKGEIVWDLGSIEKSTGLIPRTKEVAFQVVLEASVSQIGKTPSILSGANLTATDSFTDTILTSGTNGLTIFIVTDPLFSSGLEKVAP